MVGLKVYLLVQLAHAGPALPGLEAALLWSYFTQDNAPFFCLRAGGLPSASLVQPVVRRAWFLALLGLLHFWSFGGTDCLLWGLRVPVWGA